MSSSVMEVVKANVVSHDEWVAARTELLKEEKAFTRQRDELSRKRRMLPWERVEKSYEFDVSNADGSVGRVGLAELFDGRGQLVVYHFMLGPGWAEGCPSCSYLADHFDGAAVHLAHRDTTLVVISRAPLAEIEAFKKRMGWKFKWVSAFGSEFNFDYQVSFSPEQKAGGEVEYNYGAGPFRREEGPGLSVFAKDAAGAVFHSYSAYARGLDILVGAYNFLDMTPKGRDEKGLDFTMSWVKHHDRYEDAKKASGCGCS